MTRETTEAGIRHVTARGLASSGGRHLATCHEALIRLARRLGLISAAEMAAEQKSELRINWNAEGESWAPEAISVEQEAPDPWAGIPEDLDELTEQDERDAEEAADCMADPEEVERVGRRAAQEAREGARKMVEELNEAHEKEVALEAEALKLEYLRRVGLPKIEIGPGYAYVLELIARLRVGAVAEVVDQLTGEEPRVDVGRDPENVPYPGHCYAEQELNWLALHMAERYGYELRSDEPLVGMVARLLETWGSQPKHTERNLWPVVNAARVFLEAVIDEHEIRFPKEFRNTLVRDLFDELEAIDCAPDLRGPIEEPWRNTNAPELKVGQQLTGGGRRYVFDPDVVGCLVDVTELDKAARELELKQKESPQAEHWGTGPEAIHGRTSRVIKDDPDEPATPGALGAAAFHARAEPYPRPGQEIGIVDEQLMREQWERLTQCPERRCGPWPDPQRHWKFAGTDVERQPYTPEGPACLMPPEEEMVERTGPHTVRDKHGRLYFRAGSTVADRLCVAGNHVEIAMDVCRQRQNLPHTPLMVAITELEKALQWVRELQREFMQT